MNDTHQPKFKPGDMVYLKVDPSRKGPVMQLLPSVGGQPRYMVFHEPGNMPIYTENQISLETVTDAQANSVFHRSLRSENLLSVDAFRAGLTAERLSHPQVDNIYSLHAARINYIPFQFKPLLRLLRADQPRLLIADEVGVGKTIEAGLILKELSTRQELRTVLIVCPKALTTKWQKEMRRFDERFDILDASSLAYCIRETSLDEVWPSKYARSIVNLELLRTPNYVSGENERKVGLLTLSPPPHFDLVIIDEAHHVRNQETMSHEVARFLADSCDAMVMLSATPLQTGSHNLFALLNLLRPDLFPEMAVFDETLEPNPYINIAIRHLRKYQESYRSIIKEALSTVTDTTWGERITQHEPAYQDCLKRLDNPKPLTDLERIRMIRDLEEVHTLAHIMNRTRRRDIGKFTLREPITVAIPFTPLQKDFYQQLVAIRRDVLALNYGEQVARMITDTLERQASSCLPALVSTLGDVITDGMFNHFTDVQDESDMLEIQPMMKFRLQALRQIANQLPPDDPKLDKLIEVIQNTLASDGSRKLLLFSYFLHTLNYLFTHLKRRGFRVALITGATSDEERESKRHDFSLPYDNPKSIDILLSSEVGCEGLDYQFCDRMVNYDIPWNPMRIEQRIGRIDRYGQKSEKVFIYNFITPGTVEERIYFRCFERLGIFQNTIGDLEEVLGEVVEELNVTALDNTLTPEQAQLKALQTADNRLSLVEEQRRVEDEGFAALGMEESYADDVEHIDESGKYVDKEELLHLITYYLDTSGLGGQVTQLTGQSSGLYRLRLKRESKQALLNELNAHRIIGTAVATRQFKTWLEDPESTFIDITFSQSLAAEMRDIPFITPVHPLAKAATRFVAELERPLVTSLQLPTLSDDFVVTFEVWENIGLQQEIQIKAFSWNFTSGQIQEDLTLTPLLRILKSNGIPVAPPIIAESELSHAEHMLDEYIYTQKQTTLETLQQRNAQKVSRRLASLDTYFNNRLQRIRTDLNTRPDRRIQRMKKAEYSRVETEFEQRRQEVISKQQADIVTKRIAVVILQGQ